MRNRNPLWLIHCLIFSAIACAFTCIREPAFAHEGHQPLPTKGVQVDIEAGTIALSGNARDALGVESVEVLEEVVASTLEAYAETAIPWNSRAFASAQVSGRVARLLVQPGEHVTKGQVLAELASRDIDALQFEYRNALVSLRTSEELVNMSRPAVSSGSIPLRRLLDLENEVERLKLTVNIAQKKATLLQLGDEFYAAESSYNLYPVRSLTDGTIIHTDVAEGEFVEANEHLFEVANDTVLWGRVRLLEKDLTKVKVGDRASFEFSGSQTKVTGTIDFIDPHLDPVTQNAWAWSVLRDHSLLVGMSGSANVRSQDSKSMLTIPAASLFSDGMQTYVLVEEAATADSGEYRKQSVVVGSRRPLENDRLEVVLGSVYPGDRVVTQGGHELASLFFRETLRIDEIQQDRLGITVQPVAMQRLANVVSSEGIVALPPGQKATLTSQITANVRAIHAHPGKLVKKGDIVIELAGTDLQSLQLELLEAALGAELLKRRVERLNASGADAVAHRIIVEERGLLAQTEVNLSRLTRQLTSLGLSESELQGLIANGQVLEVLPLRSPMDGRVAINNCFLGQTVLPNEALIEIQNLESTWIEAKIPMQSLAGIDVGARGWIELLADPSVRSEVSVLRMSPIVDESTRTRTVWLMGSQNQLALSSPEVTYRDGMMVTAYLNAGSGTDHLAVPASALVRDGLHWFVFTAGPDNLFERKRVTIGVSDGRFTQITSGLTDQDVVVTTGGLLLQSAFATLR